MLQRCRELDVDHRVTGKLIIARDHEESSRLDRLIEQAKGAQLEHRVLDSSEICQFEPHAVGVRAIHVASAGVVDYIGLCTRLVDTLRTAGHEIEFGHEVTTVDGGGEHGTQPLRVGFSDGRQRRARVVVNCAGLHVDRIARACGDRRDPEIVPFRGEYLRVREGSEHLCRTLIYPVPDPRFPFLGVHLTRDVRGTVECGPNAVLALAREGYRWRDVNVRDLFDIAKHPGVWRLATRHLDTAAVEVWRSLYRRAMHRELQRMVPELAYDDLQSAPAGVRAQALARDGSLVHDFVVRRTGRAIHVRNAPSPAATSSFSIARELVELIHQCDP